MSHVATASTFRPSQRAEWAEGQPISELMSQALENPHLISLAAGFVDQQTLPTEETRIAFEELFSREQDAQSCLQYGTTPGDPRLRELLRDRAVEADGLADPPNLERVVVTAGSNQLLHLVVESLVDAGDIVLCASPTYLVFLGTLANSGARSLGIATDDEGLIPEALDEKLRELDDDGQLSRVKAIYLVPYFDNPRGITMPVSRVAAIIDLARRWSKAGRIHVIADEAYRELRYDGADTRGALALDDDGETVILAGTFSKSYSPGVRVGWGILPKHLVEPVCNQKGNIDFGSPNLNQQIVRIVLERGLFTQHINRIRGSYAEKRDTMLAAADEFLGPIPGVRWTKPAGGLYSWAELPENIDTGTRGELFQTAVQEGVLYVPGKYSYPVEGEPVGHNAMRLSYGVQSCERIRDGIRALANAIQAIRS
jgi:2-aminoadipate transaminase